ncbi:MAG: AAA family ATPase, partial [Acidobacteriota bacterium]
MLNFLRIRNLATIEDICLDFQKGLTLLTGETGVGKSIIIDGIRLALGEKGETDKIRSGEKELAAEAVFTPPLGRNKIINDNDGDNIFIQRIVSSKSQGKAYLNGVIVPIKKIKEISENLIDIFGQNDHVFLREKSYQLDYLDEAAGLIPLRGEVQQNARKLKQLIREKAE